MRGLAAFVMQGRSRAILAAGLFGGISLILLPFALLSAAVAGLVALRKGDIEAVLIVLGAGTIVFVATSFIAARPGLEYPLAIVLLPPVWVCAKVLRRTQSQAMALLVAGGFAALFVLGMHLFTGDVVAWWEGWLKRAVSGVKGAAYRGFEGALEYFNGLVAVVFGMCVMASILLARWWQAVLYNPGGFGAEFRALRLPKLLLPVAVASVLLASGFGRVLMRDMAAVAVMVYFFQGLAVMHGLAVKGGHGAAWLVPPYLGLLILPQYIVVGIAMAGALDSLVDFRGRRR